MVAMTDQQPPEQPQNAPEGPQQPSATVFDVVGEDGFERLTAAFYARVREDDILGPMYPQDDMQGAQDRLRDFLVYRFGGPQRYIEQRGHPRLRMRHFPFAIDRKARDRWIDLMSQALDEANLHPQAEKVLRQFFDQVATHMMNRADEPSS